MLPLSNDTVCGIIYERRNEIKNALIELKVTVGTYYNSLKQQRWLSLQFCLLSCSTCTEIAEEVLFCESLKTHTTDEETFEMVESFLLKNNLIGISTFISERLVNILDLLHLLKMSRNLKEPLQYSLASIGITKKCLPVFTDFWCFLWRNRNPIHHGFAPHRSTMVITRES